MVESNEFLLMGEIKKIIMKLKIKRKKYKTKLIRGNKKILNLKHQKNS